MSNESRAERLENLNKRMEEFRVKVEEIAETHAAKTDLRKAAVDTKLSAAKEKRDSRMADRKMKRESRKDNVVDHFDDARAKLDARKDARDQKKLDKYIEGRIDYAAECLADAILALDEAQVAYLEALDAQIEYDEKYGN